MNAHTPHTTVGQYQGSRVVGTLYPKTLGQGAEVSVRSARYTIGLYTAARDSGDFYGSVSTLLSPDEARQLANYLLTGANEIDPS